MKLDSVHTIRVAIHSDCVSTYNYDTQVRIDYSDIKDVPEQIRDRLAVLYMMPPPPPVQIVRDVGERIENNLYWVLVEA